MGQVGVNPDPVWLGNNVGWMRRLEVLIFPSPGLSRPGPHASGKMGLEQPGQKKPIRKIFFTPNPLKTERAKPRPTPTKMQKI